MILWQIIYEYIFELAEPFMRPFYNASLYMATNYIYFLSTIVVAEIDMER